MFDLFKKRKNPPSSPDILGMEDTAFVEAVSSSVREGSLPAGVMCLVAIANLPSAMYTTFEAARQSPNEKLPTDLIGFIRFISHRIEIYDGDEIGQRRLQWFFLGALVMRSGALAAKNPALVPPVVDIWMYLAEAGGRIYDTLPNNQLWEGDEKQWFGHIRNSADGMSYVVRHMAPSQLRSNERIRELVRSYDL